MLLFALTVCIGLFAALRLWATAHGAFAGLWGLDLGHYLDGTRRWIETGTPYLPAELAAPFTYGPQTFLHPPIALSLFAPFLALPAVLWWVVPWAIVGWCVASWRPAPWAWPLLAAAFAWERFAGAFIVGNTDMWVMAFLALALRYGWPWALLAVKPTYVFLALGGIRDRRAWAGGLVLLAACVPFGMLWAEWVAVVRNSPGDLSYSLANLPTVLLPVYAWAARRDDGRHSTG